MRCDNKTQTLYEMDDKLKSNKMQFKPNLNLESLTEIYYELS